MKWWSDLKEGEETDASLEKKNGKLKEVERKYERRKLFNGAEVKIFNDGTIWRRKNRLIHP